ncbi:unnamed protein product, partial [marine sediment metagenome]
MTDFLRDGTGKGTLVKVDESNRMSTFGPSEEEVHAASRTGNAFSLGFKKIMEAADTEEVIGYFQYTGDANLVMNRIFYAVEGTGLSTVQFYLFTQDTPSGGTAFTPQALNLTKTNTLEGTYLTANDSATPISIGDFGAAVGFTFVSSSNPNLEEAFGDSIIFGKNQTMVITGISPEADKLIRANFLTYQDTNIE